MYKVIGKRLDGHRKYYIQDERTERWYYLKFKTKKEANRVKTSLKVINPSYLEGQMTIDVKYILDHTDPKPKSKQVGYTA